METVYSWHNSNTDEDEPDDVVEKSKKSFLRQLMISSVIWTTYFINGLIIGSPTVVIPQLRREANSTAAVSDEMASWLSSVFGIGGAPWVVILPLLMHLTGRRIPFYILCINVFVGYIILYTSTSVTQILISEIILGILMTSAHTLSPVLITEYVSPKNRGIFLTVKSASFFWGMWISNAIGTFFHWRKICTVAFLCCFYATTALFWPESPYWLATKGRFDECATAHRWLKGTDKESERELHNLISSQREILNNTKKEKVSIMNYLINYINLLFQRENSKPILLSMLLTVHYYASGKLVCSIYAVDIVKKITHSESTAYKVMLILDGATVFAMYIGCALSKLLKRKTLLITSSVLCIIFLFTVSLYLYLVKLSVLSENNILSCIFLTSLSIATSSGTVILQSSIFCEIIPLRFKSSCLMFSALFHSVFSTCALKLAPSIFKTFGMHGTFFFFGISSIVTLLLLYYHLPETKDKTLQEIEELFQNKPNLSTKKCELTVMRLHRGTHSNNNNNK